jgi:TPR repeat protein
MGLLFKEGRGVVQSDKEAAKWWQMAADQGHAGAQFNLGNIFQKGCVVAQSTEEAVLWWRKAADQGIAGA